MEKQMLNNQDNQDNQDNQASASWQILILMVIIAGHFFFFQHSFTWALKQYEYSHKMTWQIKEHVNLEGLRLEKDYSKNNSENPDFKGRGILVTQTLSDTVWVQGQYSAFNLSNPEFKINHYQFDFPLSDASFYYSNNNSVMQNRKNMHWLINGSIQNAQGNVSRIYFKIKNPNDPIVKKVSKNKKNFYVFIMLCIFLLSMTFLGFYLKSAWGKLKQQENSSDFVMGVLGLFTVLYFMFYKSLYLWVLVEF